MNKKLLKYFEKGAVIATNEDKYKILGIAERVEGRELVLDTGVRIKRSKRHIYEVKTGVQVVEII